LPWKLAPKFCVTFSSCAWCCSTTYLSRSMLWHHCMTDIYPSSKPEDSYCKSVNHWQLKLHSPLKTVWESLHIKVFDPTFPWHNTLRLSFVGSLKDVVYKSNPYSGKTKKQRLQQDWELQTQ
jgi:hypothetical protein